MSKVVDPLKGFVFKQMPFLKKMFGDNPDLAAAFYPPGGAGPNDDSESGGDRATPPLPSSVRGLNDENGLERPQGADSPYPPSNTGSLSGDGNSPDKKGEEGRGGVFPFEVDDYGINPGRYLELFALFQDPENPLVCQQPVKPTSMLSLF